MKDHIRKILRLILLAVFVVSTLLLLRQWKDNADGAAAYQDAMAIAMQKTESAVPEVTEAPEVPEETVPVVYVWEPAQIEADSVMEEMSGINLAALREVNPEVVGWIRIPGTQIDYPMMQGEDNEFYLKNTWQKEPNSVGSIFLEHLSNPDMTDYNTIVYGHNMKNGAMFGDLDLFSLPTFWKEHPYVYILTDAGVWRYEIFAFCQPEVESLTYGLNPQRPDTKEKFLNLSLENAWYDTGIVPPITDRILTLPTGSGGGYSHRFVGQARLPMVKVIK